MSEPAGRLKSAYKTIARLQEKLEDLREEHDLLRTQLEDPDFPPKYARRLIAQLRAEIEALRKNADRYLWLRSNRLFPSTSTFTSATELDEAIDAAMAAKEVV